ncbi:PUB domain containing protein, putative [Angomonas deanei]|uniref:PUB domain containing protein, putative n=1 Tax=Angomonas deanei TaxID=59799 RepID=A0A7G2C335_9TRYP|nr:PUB domain containing protein, putative [Angomonas deanei]
METAEEDPKAFEISEALFETLLENGFSENAIKKSIAAGCIDEKTCTAWIRMHESHPELNTPLEEGVVVTVIKKKVLTEEEKQAKLAELKERIQKKKEEKKAEEHQKELERIEFGRKGVGAREELNKIKLQVEMANAQKQKREDAEAKRRVKIQLVQDKHVRLGKTEEEAFEIACREVAEAEEAARRENEEKRKKMETEPVRAPVQPSSGGEWNIKGIVTTQLPLDIVKGVFEEPQPEAKDIPVFAQAIKDHSNRQLSADCLQTLHKIFVNIRNNPFDTKMRTFSVHTNAFSSKILPVPEAVRLLRVANFDLMDGESSKEALALTTVVIKLINTILAHISP